MHIIRLKKIHIQNPSCNSPRVTTHYGISHGLASGTATTIPCSSCVRTTWHPSLECLFKTLALEFLLSTYCSSYEAGGSRSSHSCAMLTSHSAEQASMSSSLCDAGSMRPLLARALSRVWPESPTISCFWPSKSIAKSLTMRSETFLDEVAGEGEGEEAEDLVMSCLE